MPLGTIARDPNTPYHVYEWSFNGRVFYVGHTHSEEESHGRWDHIKTLLAREAAGPLDPNTARAMKRKSSSVIATLIRAGLPEHKVAVYWNGLGKTQAQVVEKRRIRELSAKGCRLANDICNPQKAELDEILNYLGIDP
jgi:hypothetical protein